MESPETGTVLKIFYKEDDEVLVLEPIAIIGQLGEKIDHLIPEKEASVSREEYIENQKAIQEEPIKEVKPPVKANSIHISPVARRFAEEKGIDFSRLIGSGPGSRIIKKDIEKAILEQEQLVSATDASKIISGVPPLTKNKASIEQGTVVRAARLRS